MGRKSGVKWCSNLWGKRDTQSQTNFVHNSCCRLAQPTCPTLAFCTAGARIRSMPCLGHPTLKIKHSASLLQWLEKRAQASPPVVRCVLFSFRFLQFFYREFWIFACSCTTFSLVRLAYLTSRILMFFQRTERGSVLLPTP